MKLEFSPALQFALDRAPQFAAHEQASQVEPRHLLGGLLAEEEGKAVALLIQSGTDWPGLQAQLGLTVLEAVAEPWPRTLHHVSQSILQNAAELARAHGDDGTITTDHLLLALLRKDSSLRGEVESFGLDFALLERSIVGETELIQMTETLFLAPSMEQIQTARILDANANRVREALRVLEDYARFVRGDAFLSEQLKQLRHDFAQALNLLPASLLLESRDTVNDVGTSISTEQEWHRPTLGSVLQANARRLQEGLRSLEEFGKVTETSFAQHIEKIRYQSYTLERAIVRGEASRDQLANVQLYALVTEELCRASLVGTVKEAIVGGAQMIQLREKDMDDRTLLARARDVRDVTRANGVLFIVNDRPDIALLSEADGVHLGQEDLPVQEARRLLGADTVIGVSTHDLEQVRQAVLEGANYIGVGPTFPSRTKQFEVYAGLEFVRQAMAETSLPAFAIGGIQIENVEDVLHAGAFRIAVSHALCAADDPRAMAKALRAALDRL